MFYKSDRNSSKITDETDGTDGDILHNVDFQ